MVDASRSESTEGEHADGGLQLARYQGEAGSSQQPAEGADRIAAAAKGRRRG
jgi:hypothetical protein